MFKQQHADNAGVYDFKRYKFIVIQHILPRIALIFTNHLCKLVRFVALINRILS